MVQSVFPRYITLDYWHAFPISVWVADWFGSAVTQPRVLARVFAWIEVWVVLLWCGVVTESYLLRGWVGCNWL